MPALRWFRVILGGMQAAVTEVPRARVSRRLRLILVASVVIPGIVVVGGVAFWNHYKIGLFGAYHAGYASVAAAPTANPGSNDAACIAVVRSVYPAAVSAGGVWPLDVQAFYFGCTEKRLGHPSDAWTVHDYVATATNQ